MKSQEVINHILNLSEFSKLKAQTTATKALKAYLGTSKQKLVRYAYISDDCLYIGATPGIGTNELKHDSIINSIKIYLNKYFLQMDSNFKPILKVKVFAVREKKREIFRQNSSFKLSEKAIGSFKNHCKDEKLKEIFEKMREVLQNKAQNSGILQ